MWVFTVTSAMKSSSAISALFLPRPINPNTSRSLSVSFYNAWLIGEALFSFDVYSSTSLSVN